MKHNKQYCTRKLGTGGEGEVYVLPITSAIYELPNVPYTTVKCKNVLLLWLIEGHAVKTQVKEVKIYRNDPFFFTFSTV